MELRGEVPSVSFKVDFPLSQKLFSNFVSRQKVITGRVCGIVIY